MNEETPINPVRAPDLVGAHIDPTTCEVMDGHQHPAIDIEELAASIAALGQIHHAVVLEYANGQRFVVAGRRRWMACKHLGIALKADIWKCSEEDIDLELFARAVRIAENLERGDPSSMDIAIQLRATRNQHGFKNARELAEHMKMGESTVKSYLSVFRASDHLQEMALQYALPLAQVLELAKCEKMLGIARTRKLIEGVCKGELVQKDLAKMRNRPERKKAAATTSIEGGKGETKRSNLRQRGDALLKAVAEDPIDSIAYIEELMATLARILPSAAKTA